MDNNNVVEVLNDLIIINNDRVEGYRKAIKELGDDNADLKSLFQHFIDNSEEHRAELIGKVGQLNGQTEYDDTTNSGKLYRVWMDMKAALSGNTRKAVLESCEFGEDAAKKVYIETKSLYPELPADVRDLISKQETVLQENHDQVKRLRDKEKAF